MWLFVNLASCISGALVYMVLMDSRNCFLIVCFSCKSSLDISLFSVCIVMVNIVRRVIV